jgi:KEOPS complex subunit Cgi121
MLKTVEGFGQWVAFAGFKNVCVGEVNQFLNRFRQIGGVTAVQFFDAGLVAGWEHLYFSVLNSLKAFESGTNISKSLSVECLLFASAQGQISFAFELIGVKKESSQVGVVVVAGGEKEAGRALSEVSASIGGKRDDSILELSDEKIPRIRRLFGISDVELGATRGSSGRKKALSDLVIEHVALLAVRR